MAKIKITVLVCDACGEQQSSDQVIETMGTVISTLGYHHRSGGRVFNRLFICLDCTEERTLGEILRMVAERDDELEES